MAFKEIIAAAEATGKALAMYQRCGFVPFGQKKETIELIE